MNRAENIIEYLCDCARTLYVDDENGRPRPLQPKLKDLPEEIAQNPELVARLERVALAAAASEFNKAAFHHRKPSRVDKDSADIMKALRKPEMLHRLYATHGRQHGQQLFIDLARSLEGGKPILDGVTLALAVDEALVLFGLPSRTSKTGLLVRTLKSIGDASGMKTNAEASARGALSHVCE